MFYKKKMNYFQFFPISIFQNICNILWHILKIIFQSIFQVGTSINVA